MKSNPTLLKAATRLSADPSTLDEPEKRFIANIKNHGWTATGVQAEPGVSAPFMYSTGFFHTAQMPEFITASRDFQNTHKLMWGLFKSGKGLELWRPFQIEEIGLYFFPASTKKCREYLTWTDWFYNRSDFPCVQIVKPDSSGLFPWEDSFDEGLRDYQPDLTESGWANCLKVHRHRWCPNRSK